MTATVPLAVDVRGLRKSFHGKEVVKGIDVQVPKGAIFGFLGPNGSGKTTSIRMICGLLKADAGEGQVLGFDMRRHSADIKRRIGYMTQRFSLYEELSVEENLWFVARAYAVPRAGEQIDKMIADLRLGPYRRQLAGTLSGGWKQRLALAACLLHEPELLLLDEPTAGVDPKARREFWNEIHQLAASGITVLVTTHYMDEVVRCHQITYISNGNLVATGTPAGVTAESGLCAKSIEGPDLDKVMKELRDMPGVASVTPLGAQIVVTARGADVLAQAVAPLAQSGRYRLTDVEPSFEDVFVELTERVIPDVNGGGAAS